MNIPLSRIIFTVVAMAALTIMTRAVPFLFFARRKPPAALDYLQKYLPPALMVILVLSAFKDIPQANAGSALPMAAAAVVTALVHLWKRNVLASIACGTALYMILIRIFI